MLKKILENAPGLFGPVSVGRSYPPNTYWMTINNEIEGQVFADQDEQPSAIAASRYLYGFIIPAWHFPASHGLMLGLGAGIGAVMLLALFPELSLTVVEIDPEVIRLTRTHFPLVSFYEKQQRLTMVQANAHDYIFQTSQKFAFVLVDIFTGDEDSQHNLLLLKNLNTIAPYFMANIITAESIRPTMPENYLWIPTSPDASIQRSNWMLTNMRQFSPEIGGFELFADTTHEKTAVKIANHNFQYILSQIRANCFYC